MGYIDLNIAKDITCQHSRRALVTCVFCSGGDKWHPNSTKPCNDHNEYSGLLTAEPNRMKEKLNKLSLSVSVCPKKAFTVIVRLQRYRMTQRLSL